jgi:hypothetical protein
LSLNSFKWTGNATVGNLRIRRVDALTQPEFGARFSDVIGATDGILAPVLPTPPSADNEQKLMGEIESGRPVTLLEVLYWPTDVAGGDATIGQLAQYCVAAYFNALNDATYAISAEQVRHIWYDIMIAGTGYCPLAQCSAGKEWGPLDAIAYLGSTFG